MGAMTPYAGFISEVTKSIRFYYLNEVNSLLDCNLIRPFSPTINGESRSERNVHFQSDLWCDGFNKNNYNDLEFS